MLRRLTAMSAHRTELLLPSKSRYPEAVIGNLLYIALPQPWRASAPAMLKRFML